MIQLTSNLDYKLTKKRLLMMGKNFSRTRSNSLKIFVAPILICIALLFCTDNFELPGFRAHELKNELDGIYYKSDLVLYTPEREDSSWTFDPVLWFSTPTVWYNENGELYTGTRLFYDRLTKEQGFEEFIEDGIITKTVRLNEKLIATNGVEYTLYQIENGHYVTITRYDENDEIFTRDEFTENSRSTYGPENQLIAHSYREVIDGKRWFHTKHWSIDGKLAYESSRDSTYDNSLSISYDEDGDTLRIMRVENGVFIEEINITEEDDSTN